jgi:hypothetical protein
VFGSPVVTHPVCDLDLRQRIREARRDAVARSIRPEKWLHRMFGRNRGRPVDADGEVFRPVGEDVGQAFRF